MVSVERDFSGGLWPFGGEGEPDDIPIPTGAACKRISEILALADEHAGEYSFGGQADMLPSTPALYVDGVGMISLPLVQEQAEKLIAKCETSPFGLNMETKTDENVRKSWQLQPDQVKFKNPQWENGITELSKIIASRLCYKGVPLECKLYKLLVYGEGGHFLKHQDTEKEDGMVATVVVQLPSVHEGGDLVVYQGGEEQHRYDFGKVDGTASYLPQYAVHYADAEHALETVTKGYRLALVYSVCLPSTMLELELDPNRTLADDLAEVMTTMGPEDESFALLLSHEYTKKSIGDLGAAALKGVDSARFRALEEANARLPTDKQLRFFIAELHHSVDARLGEEGWRSWCREQGTHWYSTSGEDIGYKEERGMKTKLMFLNPGQETFLQLWKPHGNADDAYTGNEGPVKVTQYSRFAIVAWFATKHLDYTMTFLTMEFAVKDLSSQGPVNATKLRPLLDCASRTRAGGVNHSMQFCRSLCVLLADVGDPELVKMFSANVCHCLGCLSENETLLPELVKLISMCEWSEISKDVLNVLGYKEYGDSFYKTQKGKSEVEMALHVVDGIEDKAAQEDLLKMVMEKILDLQTPETVELLWKHIIVPGGTHAFKNVIDKLTKQESKSLGPIVEVFYEHINELGADDEVASLLASIAEKRMEWLKEKIQQLDQPFSWEMPDAEFPDLDRDDVCEFLRGPEHSMSTEGWPRVFRAIDDARKFVDTNMQGDQIKSSYTMKPIKEGTNVLVKITKTRDWFDNLSVKLAEYNAELERLTTLYRNPLKKARTE